MRWEDFRRSDNIEDRRDEDGGSGGGGFGMPVGAGGLGIGTIVVLGLIGWALGIDPRLLIGGANVLTGGGSQYQSPAQPPIRGRTSKPNDQVGQFVAKVLAENEDRWKEIFQQDRQRYESPRLVLFRGSTRAGCGSQALAQMG